MRRLIALAISGALLGACGTPEPPTTTASPGAAASSAATGSTAPDTGRPVSISLGYIPDVQFAPFYVAQKKGYYAEEGLNVEIEHTFFQEAVVQVAQGQLTFAMAAGDEILAARAQGVPIRMVFQVYQQYPIAIFSKASEGVASPADLRGATVGVPARAGATYVGLQGVMYAEQIPQDDVTIAEIGFTQAEAVQTDRVPVAVGYVNNEPVQLRENGIDVNVIAVSDYINLVSNGIVASEDRIATDPDTIRRFVRATARGLQDTLDDPDAAFEIALGAIPELPAERRDREREKLQQSLALWRSDASDQNGLGYSDPDAWQTTYTFLRDSGILQQDVDVAEAFTNDFYKE